MFKYPHGDLHGLNLDWLLEEWKKFQNGFTNAFTATTEMLPIGDDDATVNVTYDPNSEEYDFHFGIPSRIKPSGFLIGYQESTSGTVIPTGTWLANPPTVAQGNYLWTKTQVVYNDGQYSISYSCSRMGVDGAGVAGTATPLMDGTGTVGTSTAFAREDHIHPSDTSKADTTDITNINNKLATIGNITIGSNYNSNVSVANGNTPIAVSTLTLPDGKWIIIGCADVSPTDKYVQLAINSAGINPARQSATTTMGAGTSKETYLQTMEILATTGGSTTLTLYCVHGATSALTVYPYFYAIELGDI